MPVICKNRYCLDHELSITFACMKNATIPTGQAESSAIDNVGTVVEWAEWHPGPDAFSVGIEEELMIIDPETWDLTSQIHTVIENLPSAMNRWVSSETQQSVLEIKTDPATRVTDSLAQLVDRRRKIQNHLDNLGLKAASAGTHPFAEWRQTKITDDEHHQEVYRSVGELARREPTFGLHVHIGIRDPEHATQVLNRLRAYLPVFLALSANSPFWQGRSTGLAATRPSIFNAFPRTGLPHVFKDYADYVATVDTLIRAGAITDPSYIWWNIRLQPRYGTVEVRVMDAQLEARDSAAIASLIQTVAMMESEHTQTSVPLRESIDENHFLAARDGVDAALIGFRGQTSRSPIYDLVHDILAHFPGTVSSDNRAELESTPSFKKRNGTKRQIQQANLHRDLEALVEWMTSVYA
jgi:glutamate---cysteine ligase / carboxylate-amine ligase